MDLEKTKALLRAFGLTEKQIEAKIKPRPKKKPLFPSEAFDRAWFEENNG